MLQQTETNGRLIVQGQVAVDGAKFPALRRALERGRDLAAKERDGWARVAELRRAGQGQAADRLVKDLLGVKGDPMPEDVKAVLRAKRAAMTDDEKRAEREKRKADRVIKRLAARRPSAGTTTNTEVDVMAKSKKAAKSKAEPKVKAERKPKAAKERDPRIPAPGNTIDRKYKGKDLSVKVLEAGFEFEGTQYPSLTALALKITGAKAISGPRFFNLVEPQSVGTK